ncbi:MAG: hypothetical protein ACFFEN_12010 [Candidatus Thorarchaeota archaeon]
MSDENENNEFEKKEADEMRWELNDIRDDLIDELDDLQDDFRDEIDELVDESKEIKEDLREELIDLEREREDLLNEIGDVKGELENLGANARERIEEARIKLENLKDKVYKHELKLRQKIRKKLDKARKKAVKRINISVDPEMSDEWRDWAEGLGASVSELVRKSMKFVKNNIGDLAKLEEWGEKMEKMGEEIEKAVEKSGIEDSAKKVAVSIKEGKIRGDKENIKKQVRGLIKLYQNDKIILIDKLANALGKSLEYAENMIYELVDEGIGGTINGEKNAFVYMNDPEEVISKLLNLIDKK